MVLREIKWLDGKLINYLFMFGKKASEEGTILFVYNELSLRFLITCFNRFVS